MGAARPARSRTIRIFAQGDDANIMLRKNYAGARLVPPRGSARRRSIGWASPASSSSPPGASAISASMIRQCAALPTRRREAHNRMMTRFLLRRPPAACDRLCSAGRFRPRRSRCAPRPIDLGAKALLIPSRRPTGHSPSHVAFDPVVGDGRRRRACRSCSMSAARRNSIPTISTTACRA